MAGTITTDVTFATFSPKHEYKKDAWGAGCPCCENCAICGVDKRSHEVKADGK